MDRAGDQFFSRATFSGDQNGRARIFEARDHPQDILHPSGAADDAIQIFFRVDALAKESVFVDQANFVGHALEQEAKFFDAEGFFDVVVSTQFHGVNGGFNRTVAGHDGHFRARQGALDLLEELDTSEVGEFQIGEDEVRRIGFEAGDAGFSALRFLAKEAQRGADGHAQAANALFVVNH